ncbi:MAG TPA: hypothetical protein VJ508_12005, partial [Saprospiraceae bacterium]|nr:hypothetical protein [Saprospiraceae bacterium]
CIQLWQRDQQPEDWPYPKKVNTRSRDYRIDRNVFDHVGTAFEIEKTDSVWANENIFTNVDMERKPGSVQVNYLREDQPIAKLEYPESLTKPMKAGMEVSLPASLPQGRKFIIINEWGPYNFQYPELVLRKIEQNGQTEVRTYDILGPRGEWMLESVLGCETPDHISGKIPDSFTTRCLVEVESRQLDLVYTGQAITDQFGKQTEVGKTYPFGDRW